MRVLSCKIHCPSFVCFCKPAPHIYSSGPLKLENSPHVPSTVVSVSDDSDPLSAQNREAKEEDGLDVQPRRPQNCPKSSLKKEPPEAKEAGKKKVQWMDFLGKELAEIREFESSEKDDTDNEDEDNRGCVCIIL